MPVKATFKRTKGRAYLYDLISEILSRFIDDSGATKYKLDANFTCEPTDKDLLSFVRQICDTAELPSPISMMAVFYLNRLKLWNPHLPVCEVNIRRLFLTAALLASKYLEDIVYRNKDWGRIAGFSLPLLNQFEVEFLARIDFNLNVTLGEFRDFAVDIIDECCHSQTEKRLLYNEIFN
ncbi:hypothetical protein RCL1_002008 [Eukaryota sp. TZLM3-RCL]